MILGPSLLELDGKGGQCDLPMAQRHRPFLANVGQGQEEQFHQRIVTGKRSPILGVLAHAHFADSMHRYFSHID